MIHIIIFSRMLLLKLNLWQWDDLIHRMKLFLWCMPISFIQLLWLEFSCLLGNSIEFNVIPSNEGFYFFHFYLDVYILIENENSKIFRLFPSLHTVLVQMMKRFIVLLVFTLSMFLQCSYFLPYSTPPHPPTLSLTHTHRLLLVNKKFYFMLKLLIVHLHIQQDR